MEIKIKKIKIEKINKLLDELQEKIEHFVNVNGLDILINIPDFQIAEICVDALRGEIAFDYQLQKQIKKYVKERIKNGNKN